jgi:F0F1-type ATP synthase assembly protein I
MDKDNPQKGVNEGSREGSRYLGVALRFGFGVVIFVLAGYGLDRWTGLLPLFTVVGTILGSVLSFVSVYREISADPANQPRRKWLRKPPR